MSAPALWLDYHRAPPGQRRFGFGVLILGIALAAATGHRYLSVTDALDAALYKQASLKRQVERQRLAADTPPTESMEDNDSAKLAQYSAQRWEQFFHALEKANGEDVTLLGLQPSDQEITITGEAKDLATALDYVGRLQAIRIFSTVHLTEQELRKDHPRHPLRFTLQANWGRAA